MIWVLVILTVYMFVLGFMDPAKADNPRNNKALDAILYLALYILWVPNRMGAYVRRLLQAAKKA
jgi:hypothetical protein